MPVEWRFTPDDVARLRFAFSPMWELVASLRVLRAPGRHSLHLPWLRAVRPRLREVDLTDLFALVPVRGYVPDFLTPPPDTPLPDFAAELERVRATPPTTAYEEMVWVQTSDPAALRRFADDPAEGVRRVADQLRAYWTVAIEEFWPRIRALLEGDVMWRSRMLAAGGVRELFADLHSTVAWHGDRLVAAKNCDYVGDLGGDGLVLVPSAFSWPDVWVMYEPYLPMLCYPARGVGTLWTDGTPLHARGAGRAHRPHPGAGAHRAGRAGLDQRARPAARPHAGRGQPAPRRAVRRGPGGAAAARPRGALPAHPGRRVARRRLLITLNHPGFLPITPGPAARPRRASSARARTAPVGPRSSSAGDAGRTRVDGRRR